MTFVGEWPKVANALSGRFIRLALAGLSKGVSMRVSVMFAKPR